MVFVESLVSLLFGIYFLAQFITITITLIFLHLFNLKLATSGCSCLFAPYLPLTIITFNVMLEAHKMPVPHSTYTSHHSLSYIGPPLQKLGLLILNFHAH